VHLNGRIYDPFVGRFLSADPEIQDPTHTQSYNRYTYVWNNPTNGTDPTGFANVKVDGSTSLNDIKGYLDSGASSVSYTNGDQTITVTSGADGGLNFSVTQGDSSNKVQSGATGSSNQGGKGGGNKKGPTGTYFFGGAGMNGKYIPDMVDAMKEEGISDPHAVDPGKFSTGTAGDATLGVASARRDLTAEPDGVPPLYTGFLKDEGKGKGGQLNLVGYSYGSEIAAQEAASLTKQGNIVDHLVLVGSPIGKEFLGSLVKNPSILNIDIINLTKHGDPLFAGMPYWQIVMNAPKLAYQMTQGEGHFYYAPADAQGAANRRELAKQLYSDGLR